MTRRPLVLALTLAACNTAPEGLSISVTPEEPTTSDIIEVVIDQAATDAQPNDTVSYRYTWILDGERQGDSAASLPSSRTSKGQTWEVRVTPTDGVDEGESASAEFTIANALPTVTLTTSPLEPDTTKTLRATVRTADADADRVETTIVWSRDGEATEFTELTVPPEATAKGETWTVAVTPNDGEAEGETVTASLTIGNAPPRIRGALVSDEAPDRDAVLSCLPKPDAFGDAWFDDDGDPEGYRVAWKVDGAEVSTDAELAVAPYERGSRIACTLTPFDGEAEGEPHTSDAVTVDNTPPTVGSLVFSDPAPVYGTDLTVTPEGVVDVDGDEVSFRYEWVVDGTKASETGPVLSGRLFRRGDPIRVTVVPNDGIEDGPALRSDDLTAGNALPRITSLDVTPEEVYTDDLLTASAVAFDDDGDPTTIRFDWYVDGVLARANSATFDGTTRFDKGDDVYVLATPVDSEDGVARSSDTLTVLNTAPGAPEVAFDVAEPTIDDDLVCEVVTDAEDADDDALTYSVDWWVDGVAYTGASTTALTGDTVASEDRADDEVWVCEITADDGEDTGPPAGVVWNLPDPTILAPGGSVSDTTSRGRGSGTKAAASCDTDEVLVGVRADTNTGNGYWRAVGARCAELEMSCAGGTCSATTGTVRTTSMVGRGGGGTLTNLDCPSGMAVTAFEGRNGWYIDQIQLTCTTMGAELDVDEWETTFGTTSKTAAAGGTGGGAFTAIACPTGEVATRVNLIHANEIEGFGLGCQEPTPEE